MLFIWVVDKEIIESIKKQGGVKKKKEGGWDRKWKKRKYCCNNINSIKTLC